MNFPTVTQADVVDAIIGKTYTILPDGRTTICQVHLKNGFNVIGMSSVVSIGNFDKTKGEQFAFEDAKEKVWAYLGYDLTTKISMLRGAGEATGLITKLGTPTTYIGTKVVRGLPMTKKAYCDLRGWDVPDNESPTEDGMLIEYVDGGTPNVTGFTGYISWSPKDVFDKAYTNGIQVVASNYVERLKVEYMQLHERHKKLDLFLGSENFSGLSLYEQTDLKDQEKHMRGYMSVLNRRLGRAMADR